MLAAAGVKWRAAVGAAMVACPVLVDRHFMSASAAKHRGLTPFGLRPYRNRMAGQSVVTLLAREVDSAALHLDGDHVESGSIVSATGLRIQIDSEDYRAGRLHRQQTSGA